MSDPVTVFTALKWTEADMEGSLEAAAPEQADADLERLNKLKAAERLLEEAWK